jgi:hypothetical protein
MDVEQYRIVDADYAIIGARADIGLFAKEAIDALRLEGLRTGVVVLPDFDSIATPLVYGLAQVKAVGVFEYAATRSGFADDLAACFLSAAEGPDWPVAHFVPRVYSAIPADARLAPQEGHLIGVVKAMRDYAPDCLILTANGLATPARRTDAVLSSDSRKSKSMRAGADSAQIASVA